MGLVEGLLLVETLDFLIHGVDEQILLLLGLLEVANVLFGTVSGATGDSDFTLHHLIVLFDLLQGAIKLVQLFLGLKDTFELFISLFLLALVLTLEDLVLTFGLHAVPLHDVVVVVSALKGRLHAGKLMLHTVELHTGFFTLLANLTN